MKENLDGWAEFFISLDPFGGFGVLALFILAGFYILVSCDFLAMRMSRALGSTDEQLERRIDQALAESHMNRLAEERENELRDMQRR